MLCRQTAEVWILISKFHALVSLKWVDNNRTYLAYCKKWKICYFVEQEIQREEERTGDFWDPITTRLNFRLQDWGRAGQEGKQVGRKDETRHHWGTWNKVGVTTLIFRPELWCTHTHTFLKNNKNLWFYSLKFENKTGAGTNRVTERMWIKITET